MMSLISCSTTKGTSGPVRSLCILDFEADMCWFDKVHDRGLTFADMSKCDEGGACWFAIDEKDLERIFRSLNAVNHEGK